MVRLPTHSFRVGNLPTSHRYYCGWKSSPPLQFCCTRRGVFKTALKILTPGGHQGLMDAGVTIIFLVPVSFSDTQLCNAERLHCCLFISRQHRHRGFSCDGIFAVVVCMADNAAMAVFSQAVPTVPPRQSDRQAVQVSAFAFENAAFLFRLVQNALRLAVALCAVACASSSRRACSFPPGRISSGQRRLSVPFQFGG